VYINNYHYDTVGKKTNALINAYFGNVIVYGTQDGELFLDADPSAAFNYLFENCLLKTHHKTTDQTHFLSCILNQDPGFVDVAKFNYEIDSISPAIRHGSPSIQVPQFDISGKFRTSPPDIGAYQYVP
jgi:hypothetical protein